MANKLKIYEIQYGDKIYEIEAEDGIAEEELFQAIPGYGDQEPQAPAPQAGVTVGDGVGQTPSTPVAKQDLQDAYEMGADTWGQAEVAKPLSDSDAQTYLEMTRNPEIDRNTLANWIGERGGVWTEESDRELATYRQAIAEGRPTSDIIQYKSAASAFLDPYVQQEDEGVGGLGAALESGMAYNPMGIATR